MKKPFFSPVKDGLLHTLIAFLGGFGCALPLCLSLGLTAPVAFIAAVCAVSALLCMLLACMPKLRFIVYPLLGAGLYLLFLRYQGSYNAFISALTLFMHGQMLALAAYSRAVSLALCVLLTLGIAFFARSDFAFFPLLFFTAAILIIVSLFGTPVSLFSFFPLIGALLLSARGSSVPLLRILPAAAMITALSLLFAPMAGQKNEALSAFAEKAKQAISDYLFFTDARTTFSLSSTGWQPLGPERIGGPVSPSDDPVMQVYTSGRTLLRGTVKNTYTGRAWMDITDQRRYLFVNPRFLSLRRDLFDQLRPQQPLRDSVLVTEPMIVSMRAPSVSTLFLTQRFTSPAGDGIVAYFSPSTEVFATRSLEPGTRYTFTGSRLTGASEGVRSAVLRAEDAEDPYLPTIRARYLALPEGIEEQVLLLAQQITLHADNDFDRAAALCSYLQHSFSYTLQQSNPPHARDFVSWFLLEEQQGYCTSFASSLAILGRAVGLPTRYVEGYAAEPDADHIARVTQENAHAWTEIYFAGFGWLPFDPTPGTGFTPDGMGDQAPDENPNEDDDEDNDEGDHEGDESNPDNTPTPSPSPTATPEPTPSPSPTASPSPTPEHNDPSVTPTPEITPAPTPQPTSTPSPAPQSTPQPPDDNPPENDPPNWPLLTLLLLLILLLAIALRLYTASPAFITRNMRKPNEIMLIWYAACTQALAALGIPALPGEAPATYMERAQTALGNTPALTTLGEAICIARYSPHKLSRTQLAKAQKTYRALLARMTLRQKLRLYLHRIVKGTKA